MPTNYDWISGSPDLEILGPTDSREVMRVTVQAQPSGVVWAMNFPRENFSPEGIAPTLERLSRGFNHAAQNPHVVSLYTEQLVNRNNQQYDQAIVGVSSSSGKIVNDYPADYAVFEPPQGSGDYIFDDWVLTRVKQLDAVEGA